MARSQAAVQLQQKEAERSQAVEDQERAETRAAALAQQVASLERSLEVAAIAARWPRDRLTPSTAAAPTAARTSGERRRRVGSLLRGVSSSIAWRETR